MDENEFRCKEYLAELAEVLEDLYPEEDEETDSE